MRICKDEFKKFERKDVKYQEDRNHIKQKIKRSEDKLKKDSSKFEEIKKDNEESSILIPKLEEEIPELQRLLHNEERLLEEIIESSKVDTEKYYAELNEVCTELEPMEIKLLEHRGRLDIASSESKLLKEKHAADRAAYEDAQQQLCDIDDKVRAKKEYIAELQANIEKNKLKAQKAQKLEQECVLKQESLISSEQTARQKVAEYESTLQAEQSQGSVLKEILQAKESKEIEGIYGQLGDLGAIDCPLVGIRWAYLTGANPSDGGPSCKMGISRTLTIPGFFLMDASVILPARSITTAPRSTSRLALQNIRPEQLKRSTASVA